MYNFNAFLIFPVLVFLSFPSQILATLPDIIPNKYIVTLKQHIPTSHVDQHHAWVTEIHSRSLDADILAGIERRYNISGFQGYAGSFDDATIQRIRDSHDVAAVESDQLGLGALSHRAGSGSQDYIFDSSAGRGTFAYVVDTGVREDHQDFGGRASSQWAVGNNHTDGAGHGTHVAGIIGGREYGVAKGATIIAVKVIFNQNTTYSDTLAGYTWAVQDIASRKRNSRSVINMSLGGGYSAAQNNAIQGAFEAGILTVVAAGNNASDAVETSPASAPNAVTVGATTITKQFAGYSNFGAMVDILAPGSDIMSASPHSTDAYAVRTGTSMASPHVAGLLLYLMGQKNYTSPGAVVSHLKELAIQDVLTGVPKGTANLMAYNGAA
ncbi:hypothetical protein M406DRAFT_62573 [Cryphonectria parasitica EP155]|uniref:Uncharacterized protein n=1 Tax=Cryphonectria parasitica (strain ATCC 38755 / EP155) TaxID=660469 RepID=A0A9P4Y081_CRYP1|nr:uncharacterized protein M406DRAFT_62573 [Cryphonectria parasitica EP155]KAF3764129.1 hypothetical protein M406DRAFT_62573 [Cryphonectria parasitica EP155]